MDDAKKQLIDKLKSSNNILVTVSRDPSVDQLASCIGLTLLLNKQGKHAAAVFSGKPPSTLEFLKPEDTLEQNTDSLRDFIISLDKGKADKLRYKVEEDVVRIFITPYKTSLSEDDLEFTEGDFNVDVVVTLGVHKQEDLDQAITAHGRILHDATVTSINTSPDGGLGTINWYDPQASSLSELVTDLAQALGGDLLDEQIATALLTGIVSETGRFSNDKTSSQTMSASAALMAAGANQQLVATKLEAGPGASKASPGDSSTLGEVDPDDGVLEIDHVNTDSGENAADAPPDTAVSKSSPATPAPPPLPEPPEPAPNPAEPTSNLSAGPKLMTEPPTMGGTLTANSRSEQLDPVTDPLSLPDSELPKMLDRRDDRPPGKPANVASPAMKPAPPTWTPPAPQAQALNTTPVASPVTSGKDASGLTLTDLEKSVGSPHADPAKLDTVRDEVNRALSGTGSTEPIEALNAQPLGDDLHPADPVPPPEPQSPTLPQPAPSPDPTAPTPPPATPQTDDSNAPPPVPPPIPFQFGNSPPSQ